jgi:helix-turn-helix protein/CheC-like protein
MFATKESFRLQPQQRVSLERVVRTTRVSAGLARRVRVLLLLAEGHSLRRIQAQTGMSPRRTLAWKRNWQRAGLDGLLDAPRQGRPKKLIPAKEASEEVVRETVCELANMVIGNSMTLLNDQGFRFKVFPPEIHMNEAGLAWNVDTEALVLCIETPCGEIYLNIAMHYLHRRRHERDPAHARD